MKLSHDDIVQRRCLQPTAGVCAGNDNEKRCSWPCHWCRKKLQEVRDSFLLKNPEGAHTNTKQRSCMRTHKHNSQRKCSDMQLVPSEKPSASMFQLLCITFLYVPYTFGIRVALFLIEFMSKLYVSIRSVQPFRDK